MVKVRVDWDGDVVTVEKDGDTSWKDVLQALKTALVQASKQSIKQSLKEKGELE